MTVESDARKFWCAAFFYRRAPDRDRRPALAVLMRLAHSSTGKAQSRALNLLRDIHNGTSTAAEEPPRAG